ncbi:MAG: hypothetical protein WD005_05550, partial [Haliea sp.]
MAENEPTLPDDFLDRGLDILRRLPDAVILNRKVANAIVEFWRKAPVSSLPQPKYLEVWDRVWAAAAKDLAEERDLVDPVLYAINDPAGKLTEELLKFLWPKEAKAGGGLPPELTDRLSNIVTRTDHSAIDASSVIVASRAHILHAVAPEFAIQSVLPLLSWQLNPSAAAYWSAFLWSARISPDLYRLIEPDFLIALRNPDRLRDRGYEILCQIFLLASLEFRAPAAETTRQVLNDMDAQGLGHISSFVRQRMLNAKEDARNYWSNTVQPWLEAYWPRDAEKQTQQTKTDFAMTAIYSDGSFGRALGWLNENGLLGETPTATTILMSLKDTGRSHEDFARSFTLPEHFPAEVLRLLSITRPFRWDHGYGRGLLDRIRAAKPEIEQTPEYL